MKEEIRTIRELLDRIESGLHVDEERSFQESFELFELPEIVTSIVDHLQPLLSPYESAVFWYMFRHSVLEHGDVYTRVSVNGLRKSVVRSASGQSKNLSQETARNTLLALEKKGAISKQGDTNREGTLYRVYLPEEIDICRERMAEYQAESLPTVDRKKELDYYNVKENRAKIFERDAYKCHYCGKQLTRFNATLDHLQPVTQGGDNAYDNLVTACLHCNSRRGSRPVMDWLAEKE